MISATLPAGTEQAATASVYPVTSQPTIPAPAWNSCDRSGMDKLSALPVKVVTNAVSTTTRIVSFGFRVWGIPAVWSCFGFMVWGIPGAWLCFGFRVWGIPSVWLCFGFGRFAILICSFRIPLFLFSHVFILLSMYSAMGFYHCANIPASTVPFHVPRSHGSALRFRSFRLRFTAQAAAVPLLSPGSLNSASQPKQSQFGLTARYR